MAISKIGSNAITDGAITADDLASGAVESAFTGQIGGRRNLIINGDAKINQRGNSTGVTGSGYVGPDRFYVLQNNDGSVDVSQNTSGVLADTGHGQSFKIDVNTADASLAAGQYLMLWYHVEAQDCQRLQYGTSNAKSATLSFWIKSNKTGTYNLNLRSYDANRMLGGSYTIDTADTWEYKTITYIGDTNTAIPNDNGQGLLLDWMFAVGTDFSSGTNPTAWEARTNADRGADTTVNLLDNTANYVEITGVQLEVGSVATPFEHRSYGEELALCQRYYWKTDNTGGFPLYQFASPVTNATWYPIYFPVEMRSSPTSAVNGSWVSNNVADFSTSYNSPTGISVRIDQSSANTNTYVYANSADDYIYADAEL